jgi:sporulation protein YlmC with PRC-barrel domain
MLLPLTRFIDTPVMSLQTGSELGRTVRPIINPRELSIVAFELHGINLDYDPSLLRINDIREIGPMGMIIDSSDELISVSDVIKIKEIYELNFELVGLKVIDDKKRNVGKVTGFTLDASSFFIQQLQVKRPLLKSFGDTEFLIHRSQVVKITDDYLVVKSPDIRHKEAVAEPTGQMFENPFRKPAQPAPETIDAS